MIRRVRENIEALRQGEALLGRLGDEQYTQLLRPAFEATLGAHIRHNLDHYACFLAGLDSGLIDYAARSRDLRVEQCRQIALSESLRLCKALEGLQSDRQGLHLLAEADEDGRRLLTATSVERELEFLLSHTIHHYSILAVMCRLQGVSVPADFGVAPSTLRHRAAHATAQGAPKAAPAREADFPACAR
ncbi:MAG: hypothetical protein RQ826_12300 [Xanthomonadales bacterium]|nr:hypothetical protein [Xanthomonadales bacterium]